MYTIMDFTNESYDMPDNLPMTDISDFSTESPGEDEDIMMGGFVPWLGGSDGIPAMPADEKPAAVVESKPVKTKAEDPHVQFIEMLLQQPNSKTILDNMHALHKMVAWSDKATMENKPKYCELINRMIAIGVDPELPDENGHKVAVLTEAEETSDKLSCSDNDEQNLFQLADSEQKTTIVNVLNKLEDAKQLSDSEKTSVVTQVLKNLPTDKQLSDEDAKTAVITSLKTLMTSRQEPSPDTSEAATLGFSEATVEHTDSEEGEIKTSDSVASVFVSDKKQSIPEKITTTVKQLAEDVKQLLSNDSKSPNVAKTDEELVKQLKEQPKQLEARYVPHDGGYSVNTEQLIQQAENSVINTEQLLQDVEQFIGQSGGARKKSNKSKTKGRGKRQISEGSNEIQRLIQRQSDEVHDGVIRKIQHLMSVNETTARKYKNEIQKEVSKGKKYSENSLLDQALAVERATTQKKLNAIKSSGKVKHPVTKGGRDARLYEEDEASPSASPSVAHRNYYSSNNSDSYALSPTSSYKIPSEVRLSTTSYTSMSPRD